MTGGRGWRRLTTTAVALAALLLSGLVVAGPSSASVGETVFWNRYLTAANDTRVRAQVLVRGAAVRLVPFGSNGVQVTLSDHSGALTLVPPAGEDLETGRTYVTSPAAAPPLGIARLTAVPGSCANPSSGTATVHAVTRGDGGALTSLAVDWSSGCRGEQVTTGVLRWNSDIPYTATSSTTTTEPPGLVGRDVPVGVVLTNEGRTAQVLGASMLRGADPDGALGSSRIEQDGCVGATLQPMQSCRVDVVLRADAPLQVSATLSTPDGTTTGIHRQPLRLLVVDPPSAPTPVVSAERGGVEVRHDVQTHSQRVERSCAGGPWTVLQEAGGYFVDTTLRPPQTCAYRTRAVVRDAVSSPSSAVVSGPLPVPVGHEGLLTPVTPARLADTRDGTGVRRGRVGAGEVLRLPVLGRGGVPTSGVLAVVLNVTAVGATSDTWITAYPAAAPAPGTSNLNVARGQVRANQVVVALGPAGQVDLRNAVGSTDLVVDVQGFYSRADGPAGAGLDLVHQFRASDTRWGGVPVHPGTLAVDLGFVGGSVRAADVTLTVTGATGPGHVTAWSGAGVRPRASNLNFAPGQTITAHAIVQVRVDQQGRGWIAVSMAGASSHVIVDVNGLYHSDLVGTQALRFLPAENQRRLLDTRLSPGALRDADVEMVAVAEAGAGAGVVVNVTALGASSNGFLRVSSGPPWPWDVAPRTSTVSFAPGEVAPVLAVSRTSPGGTAVEVLARAASVHAVVDLVGTFY